MCITRLGLQSANQHKVANIVAYIDWFNRLGCVSSLSLLPQALGRCVIWLFGWLTQDLPRELCRGLVATEICRQSQKKKRVKVIEFWVEVGKACKGLRNYNSMMAIISALNMTSVSRYVIADSLHTFALGPGYAI